MIFEQGRMKSQVNEHCFIVISLNVRIYIYIDIVIVDLSLKAPTEALSYLA